MYYICNLQPAMHLMHQKPFKRQVLGVLEPDFLPKLRSSQLCPAQCFAKQLCALPCQSTLSRYKCTYMYFVHPMWEEDKVKGPQSVFKQLYSKQIVILSG